MPFEKGKSGNPAGRQPNNRTNRVVVDVATAGVPDLPVEVSRAATYTNNYRWETFGNDNLFPQALALIFRRAVAHRSIIYHKANFIVPKQLVCDDIGVLDYLTEVNLDGETLQNVLRKVNIDYQANGNGWCEVVLHSKGFYLYHKDFTKCRVKKGGGAVLMHPDWSKVRASDDKLIEEIPLFPKFANRNGFERSIIQYKDYEPEYVYYGIPKFIAGLDVCAIAWKTNKWNVSRLDNTFQASGVLVIEGDYSDEDAKLIKDKVKETYAGEGNQGKLLTIVKTIGGANTTFTPFDSKKDGDWDKLRDGANKDLVAAHVWQRSLCNMSDAAQLGNTTLIRNEYGLATREIEENQELLLRPIRKLFRLHTKMNASSLSFTNISPVPLTDIIKPNILINENRRAFGYKDFTDEEMAVYLEEQSKLNIKQNGINNSNGGS